MRCAKAVCNPCKLNTDLQDEIESLDVLLLVTSRETKFMDLFLAIFEITSEDRSLVGPICPAMPDGFKS